MSDKSLSEEILIRLNLQGQSLGCVVAQIDFNEKRTCSLFHWQIFKSRYLALSYSDVFASPVPHSQQEFQEILLVAHRDLIENGQVDSYLREARLTKKRWTLKASFEVIQAAVRFTLITRVAPEWNSVACKAVSGTRNGELLFRGRDFLAEAAKTPIDAVRIRIFVTDGVAWLGLCACRSRLPRISLEDLEINPREVASLFANPSGFVSESQILAPWVHVIPSLKRGRVTHVSRGFPLDCIFKNHDDLRKHWKRTYGVILPTLDPSAIPVYASVSFLLGGRPFLYPMECLLRSCPPWLRHAKPDAVIFDLVQSLRTCLPTDVIVEVAGRPVAELVPAGQATSRESLPNVQSGSLQELLVRKPSPVVNNGEEMDENVPPVVKPVLVPNSQPGLHFMSSLSKKIRRPMSELSSNVPSEPRISQPQQPKAPEKPRSLAPPRGIFRLSSAVEGKKAPENSRPLAPPKGLSHPSSSNKVAKRPTVRKQPHEKTTADIESLFKVGNLRKATVTQLNMWLREKGLEAKGRAKKDDLVDRVSSELQTKQKDGITETNTSANRTSKMLMSNLSTNRS